MSPHIQATPSCQRSSWPLEFGRLSDLIIAAWTHGHTRLARWPCSYEVSSAGNIHLLKLVRTKKTNLQLGTSFLQYFGNPGRLIAHIFTTEINLLCRCILSKSRCRFNRFAGPKWPVESWWNGKTDGRNLIHEVFIAVSGCAGALALKDFAQI